MSFEARDLMVNVLPLAHPDLVLCGQATAGGRDEEEDDDGQCGQATADQPGAIPRRGEDGLPRLRQQLRQRLASETPL